MRAGFVFAKVGLAVILLVLHFLLKAEETTGREIPKAANAYVEQVKDGDTFVAKVPIGFLLGGCKDGPVIHPRLICEGHELFWQGSIRILGIDTPESFRPKCDAEKAMGLAAKHRLKTLIEGKRVILSGIEEGKYAGRLLASVAIDGQDIVAILLQEQHAVVYGGGKRRDWCGS